MNKLTEPQIFWNNLEKIRQVLLVEEDEFAALLDMSHRDFVKCRRDNHFLAYSNLYNLTNRYNYQAEDLVKEDFNIDRILDFVHSKNSLEERYSYATYSSFIPILNILNYLEYHKGIALKIDILKRFQIPPNFLYSSKMTNIHLISDICQYLKYKHGLQDFEFLAIGQQMADTIRKSMLMQKLRGVSGLKEIITIFVNDIAPYLDQNYHYKLTQLTNDYAIIDSPPRQRLIDELGVPAVDISNETVCFTRMGIMSSISTFYQSGQYSKVTKVASLFSGAKSHQYVIDLAPFKLH